MESVYTGQDPGVDHWIRVDNADEVQRYSSPDVPQTAQTILTNRHGKRMTLL